LAAIGELEAALRADDLAAHAAATAEIAAMQPVQVGPPPKLKAGSAAAAAAAAAAAELAAAAAAIESAVWHWLPQWYYEQLPTLPAAEAVPTIPATASRVRALGKALQERSLFRDI
jgi:hypothetical protein